MKRKDLTPLFLSFFLIAAIFLFGFIRYKKGLSVWSGYLVDIDIVFAAIYILWIFAELPIARKDVCTEGKQTSDSGTCQIYAFGQAAIIISALWFKSFWRVPNAAHFAGIVIFLCGICFRLWAIRTLGKFYSHKVRKTEQHRIVDSGPYRFIRHPAYAGMIVANSGICIYFFNMITVCLFFFVLIPSIIFRIIIEEKMLFEIEGYAGFAAKRNRLFPGIW